MGDLSRAFMVGGGYSFWLSVEIDRDAFGLGWCCINGRLATDGLFSQAFLPIHHNKAVYEHKLMAIVLAVQKWRPHHLGRKFTFGIDHKS